MNEYTTVKNDWTENDWKKFSSWLKGILKQEVVTVTFLKKDGTERIMKCTLNEQFLPDQPITENKKERKVSQNTISVFDIEAKGWRSFIIQNIRKISITLE